MSRIFLSLVPALLAGCASIPNDRGLSEVQSALAARGQVWSMTAASEREAATQGLLAQPLHLDDAVSLALLNNPRVDQTYARLGLAGAEVLQAGRLSNPRLSASLGLPLVDHAVDRFSFGLSQDFLQLLLLPARTRLARKDFDSAKAEAGATLLDLAADVAEAYYGDLGAEQVAALEAATADAARISAEYAQALANAGNIDQLTLLLQQAAAAQAEADALDAQARYQAARSTLSRAMGLPAESSRWQLAPDFGLPVAQEDDATDLVALAYRSRLDLQAAQSQLVAQGDVAGLSRATSLLGGSEIGADYQRDTDGIRSTGPTATISIPLFDQGQAAHLQAQARIELARAQLASLRLDISNQVRAAADRVASARSRIQLIREHLLPLRRAAVAATQQRVNYALLSTFEALAAKQQEYQAQQRYLGALGDYWQARVALARAVGAKLPSDARIVDGDPAVVPPATSDGAPSTHSSFSAGAAS